MSGAVRPWLSAGVALASVGVIAAAPLAESQQVRHVVNPPVSLAASSIANVPRNILNALLNIPAAELAGVQRLTAAMVISQSWYVYSDVNVLGWDPGNPEMLKGLVDMMFPFPAFSTPAGEQLNWLVAANLPMNAGCTGFPPCADLSSLTNVMFRVPVVAFLTGGGYTFAEPVTPTNNPVSVQEGQWNFDLGQTGAPVSWYAHTVKLEPLAGVKSALDYLTDTPGTVEIPTVKEIVDTYAAFAKSLWASLYPFVPQSVLWNPYYSISALITRPFYKLLCQGCNSYDPFMPVGWEPGDWVPDAFTYVPTSPYNPFVHYPVSHGPEPVEYDFAYSTEVAAGAGSAASASAGQQDQAPRPAAAPTRALARASSAASRPATAAVERRDSASRTGAAQPAAASPKASRAGLAKNRPSRADQ